jgi:hypothetical protein
MFRFRSFSLVFLAAGIIFVGSAVGQPPDPWNPDGSRRKDDDSKILKDMLAKQQSEREKKDYEEMLQHGEEALELTTDLEKAFEKSATLTAPDQKKLADLEKVVRKIRDELGGSDDEEEGERAEKTEKPSNLKEGFNLLRSTTVKLVDELKKTTRFSISAAAIQTSNTVIKVIRFLRLKN